MPKFKAQNFTSKYFFMAFIILITCILILLTLITFFNLSAFIALIITAICAGILQGMDLPLILKAIQNGIGSTLGGLTLILGFGVMLGHMLSESGAAQRISTTMIDWFGVKRVKLAMVITVLMPVPVRLVKLKSSPSRRPGQ